MAGETVLVIEDSSSERDYAKTSLEDNGYKVVTAANAAAALTYPEVKEINLIVMDSHLMGISGFEATRMLRQQGATHPIPILLLIPDEQIDNREDVSPRGANGFLIKPYDSRSLSRKVAKLIEEQHLEDLAHQYLENTADTLMKQLSEKHIKAAVERKTQIIIERCIQNVATAVEQRARAQVNESVTALTAEKEQELVKFTVREVAQSMVEKLAERKVTEAMETVLAEQAERTVKRIADQLLPSQIRERLKETLDKNLPREIQTRVQRQLEKEGPEIGKGLVTMVEDTAKNLVPRVVREISPDIVERQLKIVLSEQVPRLVQDLISRELDAQMMGKLDPTIRETKRELRKYVTTWNVVMGVIGIAAFASLVIVLFFGDKLGLG